MLLRGHEIPFTSMESRFDGWDNVVKCPLLMMFTCPHGDVFLCAINIVKEHKDGHYICNALVGYIETIGVDNIVQIYTKIFQTCRM
jgi:hypothetical protein